MGHIISSDVVRLAPDTATVFKDMHSLAKRLNSWLMKGMLRLTSSCGIPCHHPHYIFISSHLNIRNPSNFARGAECPDHHEFTKESCPRKKNPHLHIGSSESANFADFVAQFFLRTVFGKQLWTKLLAQVLGADARKHESELAVNLYSLTEQQSRQKA